ncbi:TPA: hypothetical protein ACFCOM_001512 [Neisseria gonorrhoeae]
MAKYAERGGLTQSRHDFTTPMPSETGFASNSKPENIVSNGKIVNNTVCLFKSGMPALLSECRQNRCRLKAVSDGIVPIFAPPL